MVTVAIFGSARVSTRCLRIDFDSLVVASVDGKLGCGLQEGAILRLEG